MNLFFRENAFPEENQTRLLLHNSLNLLIVSFSFGRLDSLNVIRNNTYDIAIHDEEKRPPEVFCRKRRS